MKIAQEKAFEKARTALYLAQRAATKMNPDKAVGALTRLGLWREYLANWKVSYQSLSYAGSTGAAKSSIDRMKHSVKNDEVLQFIFQARNVDAHDDETAVLVPSELSYGVAKGLPSAVLIKGDFAGVWFEGNTLSVDGVTRRLPSMIASVEESTLKTSIQSPADVRFTAASIHLKALESRGKTYNIPFKDIDPSRRPHKIAVYGTIFLEEQIDRLHAFFD